MRRSSTTSRATPWRPSAPCSPTVRDAVAEDRKLDAARKVGEAIAKICLEKNITKVVFDRNGYVYQQNNRIGALADAARKTGLNF